MKITNSNKIPLPIYRAISQNWYSGNSSQHFCSITSLLKGAKQFVLERRHQENIETEASELVWSLLGSAMHKVLEASENSETLIEERLETELEGKIISGGIDHYENGIISDFKFTSVWSWIYESKLSDWEKQLNSYAYLYQKAGFPVDKLQIICVFRDWQKAKFRYKKQFERYPYQIEVVKIRKWTMTETEEFLKTRIKQFEEALNLPDDLIEPCSMKERWEGNVLYAVTKKGANRATKINESQSEAEIVLERLKDKGEYYIETRLQEPKKCLEYCPVNQFCNFYQQRLKEHIEPSEVA